MTQDETDTRLDTSTLQADNGRWSVPGEWLGGYEYSTMADAALTFLPFAEAQEQIGRRTEALLNNMARGGWDYMHTLYFAVCADPSRNSPGREDDVKRVTFQMPLLVFRRPVAPTGGTRG